MCNMGEMRIKANLMCCTKEMTLSVVQKTANSCSYTLVSLSPSISAASFTSNNSFWLKFVKCFQLYLAKDQIILVLNEDLHLIFRLHSVISIPVVCKEPWAEPYLTYVDKLKQLIYNILLIREYLKYLYMYVITPKQQLDQIKQWIY